MVTRILFIGAAVSHLAITAQVNLVPNPGFDTVLSCPTFPGQWDKCKGWNNVNLNTGPGMHGTPDFYHSCGTGSTSPPATFAGTCSPHSGSGMMGLVLYNAGYADAREYLSAKLNCAMEPGYTYTVSFWITNGTGLKSPYVIKNVGVHFSQNPLSQTGFSLITVNPQLEVTSYVQSTAWVQYSFTIIPSATFSYITIGNFRTDQANGPIPAYTVAGGPNSAYAHYYLDDIAVLTDSCACGHLNLSLTASSTTVCAGQSVSITAGGASTFSWNNNVSGPLNVVSPTVATAYSVMGYSGGCEATGAITIHVHNVNIAIQGPTLVCQGQQALLTASGASSYTWSTGHTGNSVVYTPTAAVTVYSVNALTSASCAAGSTFTVQLSECISTDQHHHQPFSVYPNPATGEFMIDMVMPLHGLSVTDASGRSVGSEISLHDGKPLIRLKEKNPGVYILRSTEPRLIYKVVITAD